MVASYSSQRFSALLDFQRDVDLVYPSHIGNKSPAGFTSNPLDRKSAAAAAPNHHRARHGGDSSWQHNWSESLSAFLSSTFRPSRDNDDVVMAMAPPPRPFGVEAARRSSTTYAITRSQGQFSPQKFIRNALKRAFVRDEFTMNVKRARFEDFGSTPEPMVCG